MSAETPALPEHSRPTDVVTHGHPVGSGDPGVRGEGVEFGVLGPVTIWHGGRQLAVGSAQQRCLLAVLVSEAGRVVSLERLVDALWDDDAVPRTARNVVQKCVSELRKLVAVDPEVGLAHRPPGYVLEVEPERVDLHRFRALVARARGADDRVVLLRRALELWRGEPLADVPGLASVKQALVEERLAVLEDCLAAEVDSGRHAEAIPQLRALVAERPLRERPTGLLMLALYRGGRQADALEHYQHARQRLAEELGTDPSPALRELHQRILTADASLTTTEPAPPGGNGHTVVPRQLPAAPAPFVGRHDALDRLDTALNTAGEATTVLITAIGGAGGIGKTWLALHWAHRHADRFPDGQLFVDLRGFSPEGEPMEPAVAVRGFLDALGVDPGRIPVEPHAQAALFRSLVADKRMLIVLDNAADTTQITPLLPGSRTCTVVLTSRNRLPGLITGHSAQHVSLDVLTDSEARALLADRLGTGRVDAEPAAVEKLVRVCGGFPLALSIIAAHAHTRPHLLLAAVAAELLDLGLDALDDEDPTASLPAVLSWSHRALTPELRQVFALLGIAPGPDIGLPAAASLTALPLPQARKALRTLEDASLLTRDAHGRYTMHDLIRGYATAAAQHDLAEHVREPALRRVVDFYVHTSYAADRLLNPHSTFPPPDPTAPGTRPHPLVDVSAALAWLDTEHANLLAAQHLAATHRWHHLVWPLAWALTTFHVRRGHRHDDVAVWQAAVDAAAHLSAPAVHIRAHRGLGIAYSRLERHDEATGHLHQALALAQYHRDTTEQAHTHHDLALAWTRHGDDQQALEHAQRALALFRELDRPVFEAITLNSVGWLNARLGDYDTARVHCRAALTLHRRHRDPEGEAATLDSLGYIDHHTGHHRQAVEHYGQALILRRDHGNTDQATDTLKSLGHPYAALGEREQARAVWQEALELYRQQGRDADAERVRRQLDALDGDTRAW
ncbi:AfsR/SARP family transcriptional regulator [Saccharothrix deserti]|uniref:AfsR/SARP family transcriptional regulator n=1 Tax=Saccharothrix deserti TaxID=2593674 RepID=UPI00131D36A2|nr:BTAD domain-containing putative transcriptional regulator [Saccharothrix deserti]